MAPYTLESRVSQLTLRRLINPSPFAATARFNWVGQLRYTDPNWYPGEAESTTKQRVNKASPTWRVYATPTNRVVRPLQKSQGYYPSPLSPQKRP